MKDPNKYGSSAEGFKAAFMDAVSEYNSFGYAATNARYRVDDQAALELFGFKASWPVWIKHG